MEKRQSFEDFLEDKHAKDYMGTDDDMPDAFSTWLTNLDADELINYGDDHGKEQFMAGFEHAKKIAFEII